VRQAQLTGYNCRAATRRDRVRCPTAGALRETPDGVLLAIPQFGGNPNLLMTSVGQTPNGR